MASFLGLTATDFKTGLILLTSNDKTEVNIDATIEEVEEDILQDMFGKELYDLFRDDLALPVITKPTDQRFVDIFESFFEQDDCRTLKSKGIIVMIKQFVWAEVVKGQPYQNTSVGMVRNEAENASIATPAQYGWALGYNKGVNPYAAIQAKMIDDPDTYPEFEGLPKQLASAIV